MTIQGIQASFNGMEHSIRPLKKKGKAWVFWCRLRMFKSTTYTSWEPKKGSKWNPVGSPLCFTSGFRETMSGFLWDHRCTRELPAPWSWKTPSELISEATETGRVQPKMRRSAIASVRCSSGTGWRAIRWESRVVRTHLKNNVVSSNKVGAEFQRPAKITGNEPAKGAYDACACEPTLPGAKPGTTLFYSSGCNGCKVHEEWLPGLREKGADILLRASDPERRKRERSTTVI